MCTFDKSHPLAGMCSPPLMGSSGVCPLVIIATIPKICCHMSNLIAKAQKEVFLATNFGKYLEGSRLICNALRELSKRALSGSRRVVVKVMYDRGDPKQVFTPHQFVPANLFADPNGAIRLPHPDDLPNVDLEVVNYHRPPLATFHAKFMIGDRRIGILQSNNMQDNDNLEMMTQFEGPIVDSLYDMALITWHNHFQPPLPMMSSPASSAPSPTFNGEGRGSIFDGKGQLRSQYSFTSIVPNGVDSASDITVEASIRTDLPLHSSQVPHYDDDVGEEMMRAAAAYVPRNGAPLIQGVNNLLNVPVEGTKATAPDLQPFQMMTPIIPITRHDPFPIAMVCREPFLSPTNASVHTPQNAAFQSGLRNATSSVFIQTSSLNAAALLSEIVVACTRGVHVNYVYCLGYNDAGKRINSLNALLLNAAGELLPMQGGHNESVANKLYSQLTPESRQNLNTYCYIGKDQVTPIHNKFKKRSCHIKLMIVDDHIRNSRFWKPRYTNMLPFSRSQCHDR